MFLELTQFGEPYSLATLLMRLSGRVAEYVLLSLPGGVCHQHHAVHALIDVLDSAILGDVTHRTHKGVHQLTSCTRGSKEMGSFLMDFQLRCQMLAGLGKHIDENVLGTMLLNQANMFDLDRKLLMAQTGRSKAYSEIYDSNNITPSSRPPPCAVTRPPSVRAPGSLIATATGSSTRPSSAARLTSWASP